MGGLLAGNAPLRGRAGLELVVPPLDYRLAAEFWGIDAGFTPGLVRAADAGEALLVDLDRIYAGA